MPNTPILQQFLAQVAPLAQQYGITTLMFVGRDPQTQELGLFADQASMEAVREFVEAKMTEKLGMIGETSWNDT